MVKVVYCNALKANVNKDTKCPNWNCNNCPDLASQRKPEKDVFAGPKSFSKIYLQYLSQSNSIFMTQNREVCNLPFPLTEKYRQGTLSNKDISVVSKYLSKPHLVVLRKLDPIVKKKILIALDDITTAVITEETLKKYCKEGKKEREKHLEAVNALLNASFISPYEKEMLQNMKSFLEELKGPIEYTFEFWLNALEILYSPTSGAVCDNWMYAITHKNVLKTKPGKPFKFSQDLIQIVIWQLLVEGGKQKRESSKNLTAEMLNHYFNSYHDGRYKHLAKFTYKTVDNALHCS